MFWWLLSLPSACGQVLPQIMRRKEEKDGRGRNMTNGGRWKETHEEEKVRNSPGKAPHPISMVEKVLQPPSMTCGPRRVLGTCPKAAAPSAALAAGGCF